MRHRKYILLLTAVGLTCGLTSLPAAAASVSAESSTESATESEASSAYMSAINEYQADPDDVKAMYDAMAEQDAQSTLVYSPSLDEYFYPDDADSAQKMADEKGLVIIGSLAFLNSYEEANADTFSGVTDSMAENDLLQNALADGKLAEYAKTYYADGAHSEEAKPTSVEDYNTKMSAASETSTESAEEEIDYGETVYHGFGDETIAAFTELAGDSTIGNCNMTIVLDTDDTTATIPASALSKLGETGETVNFNLYVPDEGSGGDTVKISFGKVTTDKDLDLNFTLGQDESNNDEIKFATSQDLGYDITMTVPLTNQMRSIYTMSVDGAETGEVASTSRGLVTFTTAKLGDIVFTYKEDYYSEEKGNTPDIVPDDTKIADRNKAMAEAAAAQEAEENGENVSTKKPIVIICCVAAAAVVAGIITVIVKKRK